MFDKNLPTDLGDIVQIRNWSANTAATMKIDFKITRT